MSRLISLLNSGESLEKAIVLSSLALKNNINFYSNYKEIIILYSENLPKKEKGIRTHGTLGALIENIKNKDCLRYKKLTDFWEDRDYILNKIQIQKRISERLKEKLLKDKERFDKIIPEIPWYSILEEFKETLLKRMDFNFLNFESLNCKQELINVFDKTPRIYNGLIKLRLLNPNGSISFKTLWKTAPYIKNHLFKNKKILEPIKKSIVASPNVFTFILSSYYLYPDKTDLSIGFRWFNKKDKKRISYDKAIQFLQEQKDSKYVEEPRNNLFNDRLDKIDQRYGNISLEKKINLALYGYLNEIL